MKLAQIIKLPTKTRRKYYANKFFSLNSLVEISRTAVAVLTAETLVIIIKRVL